MTIEIRMNYYTHGNERVCIAGDMFQGQKWEPHQMKPVNGCAEDGWWVAKFDLPKSCEVAELNYKFVVIRDNGNNRWEECANREVSVEVPFSSCLLSFTDYWAYPLESKLTVSEQPAPEPAPAPVVEKKAEEKKAAPVVEKKPAKKVEEKKPEPVKKAASPAPVEPVKKAASPVPVVVEPVKKAASPVEPVKKAASPVEPVKKATSPVEPVKKAASPAAEAAAPVAAPAEKRKSMRKSQPPMPDEEPQRETVTLKHVEPKPAEPAKPKTRHQKSGSIVEDCKRVFEPDGTPVEVPQFLRNSMKGSSSSSRLLAKYK